MKKIKVLILGSDSNVKGGITSVIDRFINNKWNEVHIELHPTYIEGNNIKKIIFFVKSVFKYIIKLIKNDFDIAHIHMSYKGSFFRKFIILKTTKLFKKKAIIHLHGSEFEQFYNSSNKFIKKMIKNLFDSSDYIIVLGDEWKKVVSNISFNKNIKVFNNAVNIPQKVTRWNEKNINIVFLGVLINRKGIDDLIESISILNKKKVIENYKLKFKIGGTGPRENDIKLKIKENKLEDCVDMLGWVNKELKQILLEDTQLFVLPSYNEGLPMAILECISYGIPVISTNVGSIEEAIIDNYNGFLIKPKDINGLVEKIIKLTKNRETWQKFSKNARELCEKKFNESNYFIKMEELYKFMIK